MRNGITFMCEGANLAGAIDHAGSDKGVLIVSGGNEILSGSHAAMAKLADMLSDNGVSVFRYDRRGVGDSEGENFGFAGSKPDIEAALRTFKEHCPTLSRIVATGNCDGATALALFGKDLGFHAMVLSNCWLRDERDSLPSAAAIRGRYSEKLKDPREWRRLLTGAVNIQKLVYGLKKAIFPPKPEPGMEERLANSFAASSCPITLLNASRDATAMAFTDALRSGPLSSIPETARIEIYDSNSHSFAGENDLKTLHGALIRSLD